MPREMVVKGKKHTMYQIGELSGLVGRDSITVRKWENHGHIPRAALRDNRGQRLYFKAEVDALVKIVAEEFPRAGIGFQKTRFKERTFSEWKKIREKYLGGDNENSKEKADGEGHLQSRAHIV
jgi:hypothetical protein